MPPPVRRTITVKRAEPPSTSAVAAETSAITRKAAMNDIGPKDGKESETSREGALSPTLARMTKDVGMEQSAGARVSSSSNDMSDRQRTSTREQETRKSSDNEGPRLTTGSHLEAGKTSRSTDVTFTSSASVPTRTTVSNVYTFASGDDPPGPIWGTPFASPSRGTVIISAGPRGTAAATEPTRPATSTIPYHQEPEVPELPEWLVLFTFASLLAGLILTIVLYFANFPPSYPKWILLRKKRYEYMRIGDLEEDLHGDIYRSFRKRSAAAAAAAGATSVYSPHLHEARRRLYTPGVNLMRMGLGISVTPPPRPLNPLAVRKRPSFEADAAQLYRPFPKLPSKAAPNTWRSLTDPLPNVKSFLTQWDGPQTAEQACYELRERQPDVESGLLKSPSPDFDSGVSIASSRSSSSSRLSSSDVFNKIADGVDYAASKLARMMDHQVRDDPEEGLLLPTRAVRRGRKLENGKLKKVL